MRALTRPSVTARGPLRGPVAVAVAALSAAGTIVAAPSAASAEVDAALRAASAAQPARSATATTGAAAATSRDVLPSATAPAVTRLSGADRYATSAAVSRASFPQPTARVVYLASGSGFADALSAGPAATAQGGSLLLTAPSSLPAATATELDRLRPPRVVVVGGPGAVSDAVLRAARAYSASVTRVGGRDRYATSEAVARAAFPLGVTSGAVVATGRDFPDALTAGPAAGSLERPLVVVDGHRTALPASTRALLGELGVREVLLAGGTSAVSAALAQSIASGDIGTGGSHGQVRVTRAGGADRYATAVAVNAAAFASLEPGDAFVAMGTGFPDALSVGSLAGLRRRPLFLSVPYCVPASVRPTLTGPAVSRVVLVGGVAALRGNVGRLVPCQSISAAASPWVVVNQRRPLAPRTYAPSPLVKPSISNINGQLLRSDAAAALAAMASGSQSAGAGSIAMLSGYRSYSYQSGLYAAKVASAGRAEADRWVARPGYSEHQTALATDISPVGASGCSAYTCIGKTPQGRWLAANSWRYGFVLRYESGQSAVTGYQPEPWHFRYVGPDVARDYREGGFHSLEAYFGLRPAPRY